MDIDIDIDRTFDIGRRDFLKAAGLGATSIGVGYGFIENSGVSEDQLDELYIGGFPGLDQDRPNLIVDTIEIGDNYLQQEVIDIVENIYDKNGINAVIGRRKQDYSEENFQKYYGGDVAKILGSSDYTGFVENQVSSVMRKNAVQTTIITPGKPDNPEGWLHYKETYRTGFANDSVALGSDKAFEHGYPEDPIRGKSLVLMHELGHAYGLEHNHDPSNVMYENVDLNADLEYSEDQWEHIKNVI